MSGYTTQSRNKRSWFKMGDNWDAETYRTGKSSHKETATSAAIDLKQAKYTQKNWIKNRKLEERCNKNLMSRMRLSEKELRIVTGLMNAGIAETTKKTYRSAINMIEEVERKTESKFNMPWSATEVIRFICHCKDREKPLAAASIKVYLAGVRMMHLWAGHHNTNLKPDIVQLILRGSTNLEEIQARQERKKGRQAITWDLMRTIRYKLQKSRKSKQWKRNVWCVCTLAFMGSFRIHELLCRYTTIFSSERELMAKQVKLGKFKTKEGIKEYLEVFISHPKEEKLAQGIKIEVFEVKGKECWACPVAAWKDMKKRKEVIPNRPLITREDGRNYTGTEFNRDLKAILEGEVDYKEGKITSHSFRSGLASWMAKCGYSDEQIQLTGRWKSSAFLKYIKTSRAIRSKQAESLVNNLVAEEKRRAKRTE